MDNSITSNPPPPIEARNSRMHEVSGLFGILVALTLIFLPFIGLFLFIFLGDETSIWHFRLLRTFLFTTPLSGLYFLFLLLPALKAAFHRIRIDDAGVHVRLLIWRHCSWDTIQRLNLVEVNTRSGASKMFVPGDFREYANSRTQANRIQLWGMISPFSFPFNTLDPTVAEAITKRIQSYFSLDRGSPLPESLLFRTSPWPCGKRVQINAEGIVLGAGKSQTRHPWSSVKKARTWGENSPCSCSRGATLLLDDDTFLQFDRSYPASWFGIAPEQVMVSEYLRRYTKLDVALEQQAATNEESA